jgi:hypothetical protein
MSTTRTAPTNHAASLGDGAAGQIRVAHHGSGLPPRVAPARRAAARQRGARFRRRGGRAGPATSSAGASRTTFMAIIGTLRAARGRWAASGLSAAIAVRLAAPASRKSALQRTSAEAGRRPAFVDVGHPHWLGWFTRITPFGPRRSQTQPSQTGLTCFPFGCLTRART